VINPHWKTKIIFYGRWLQKSGVGWYCRK